ncbi:hypothetical protein [uncultured Brevibacillus sp.]|uniref:hypothetical protein n=1 Tax=uncultured Brevibacillus sp. TaxID=169970 RepID=UPI002593BF8F|nr:hypothetical protein [uncultured Brevibacillus sp.]
MDKFEEENDLIKQINALFMSQNLNDPNLYRAINTAISQLDNHDQMILHSQLTEKALNNLHFLIEHLLLNKEVKEHLLYRYYHLKITSDMIILGNDLFNQLCNDYAKYQYVSLESIFVLLIKNDNISNEQAIKLTEMFGEKKAIKKQLISFKARQKVKENRKLDKEDVMTLLEWNLYSNIEDALAKSLVLIDALQLFKKPSVNEKDKRHKDRLYQTAQSLLRE